MAQEQEEQQEKEVTGTSAKFSITFDWARKESFPGIPIRKNFLFFWKHCKM